MLYVTSASRSTTVAPYQSIRIYNVTSIVWQNLFSRLYVLHSPYPGDAVTWDPLIHCASLAVMLRVVVYEPSIVSHDCAFDDQVVINCLEVFINPPVRHVSVDSLIQTSSCHPLTNILQEIFSYKYWFWGENANDSTRWLYCCVELFAEQMDAFSNHFVRQNESLYRVGVWVKLE